MPNGRRTKILELARENRRTPTGSEARLRKLLLNANVGRIRRQIDVGNLIIDFGLPKRNLLIEVDGPSHQEKSERDLRRDAWLRAAGFRVLRISNKEVLDQREDVVTRVLSFVESETNRQNFNLALRVARRQTDLTHSPQPPSP
jgi:very-short-patch-repair endonuclease